MSYIPQTTSSSWQAAAKTYSDDPNKYASEAKGIEEDINSTRDEIVEAENQNSVNSAKTADSNQPKAPTNYANIENLRGKVVALQIQLAGIRDLEEGAKESAQEQQKVVMQQQQKNATIATRQKQTSSGQV